MLAALVAVAALAYRREKKLPTVIVRLFNTIGPRQTGQHGMVVPTLTRQAEVGEPITVFGKGLQTRCLGCVGDVGGALIALSAHPDAVGRAFNIGSNEEVTVVELPERFKKPQTPILRLRTFPMRRLKSLVLRTCRSEFLIWGGSAN